MPHEDRIKKADKFLMDIEHHAIEMMDKFMSKELAERHPVELDVIAGYCDLHNKVCDVIAIIEKRKAHKDQMHDWWHDHWHDKWHDKGDMAAHDEANPRPHPY